MTCQPAVCAHDYRGKSLHPNQRPGEAACRAWKRGMPEFRNPRRFASAAGRQPGFQSRAHRSEGSFQHSGPRFDRPCPD